MIRRGLALLGIAVALLASAQGAAAQAKKLTVSVNPSAIAFPTPTVTDFDLGYVDFPGVDARVRAQPNTTVWDLYVRAADPDMGGYGKPLADLLWRVQGAGAWTAITTTDQLVMTGSGNQRVSVDFRMLLDWAFDGPGSYAAGLVFTVVEQ